MLINTHHCQHELTPSLISKNALLVITSLQDAGFAAYLVGGSVRDILLNLKPKDFDLATDASPEEIKKLFRNCQLIGKRFRLAHVRFRNEIIEVATFRRLTKDYHAETGMILRDNVYGTQEEDALRRDFSINALYYDPSTKIITDFTGGLVDLKNRTMRIIGNAALRYQEDPVRMLRALRLSAKLNLSLTPETAAPIKELAQLLQNIPHARLFDELLKWFFSGNSLKVYQLLNDYNLFNILFPQITTKSAKTMLQHGFRNADKRISDDKSLNPAFFFAFLLWHPLSDKQKQYCNKSLRPIPALQLAIQDTLKEQRKLISIPQRFSLTAKSIWLLQQHLTSLNRKHIIKTLAHPRFRAAYDFLLLRAQSGEPVQDQAKWWTAIQDKNSAQRQKMINEL